jgi:hypothetical protein
MPPNQRKLASVRIYNTYLSTKHATLPVKLGKRLDTDGGVFAINAVRIGMDNPDAHLFDDVAYISLRTLQDIYDGVFSDSRDNRGSSFKDDDAMSIETQEHHLLFEESAFYQAMLNDLRKTKILDQSA